MMRSRSQVYRYIPPLIMVAIGVVLLWRGIDPAQMQTWFLSFGSTAPIMFVAAGVVLMSICVPKTVMSITAGALFGTWWGSGLMLITGISAAMMNYVIGRWWLSDSRASKATKPVNEDELIPTIRQMAADANFGAHLLIRLSPVPTMVISYLMGACRAKIAPYAWAAAVAMIPQMLWVHSGTVANLAGESTTSPARWVSVAVAVVGGVLVSVLIPREVARRWEVARRLRETQPIEGAPTA